jgi:glycosyltransferase involved in cell wall biosynthesis
MVSRVIDTNAPCETHAVTVDGRDSMNLDEPVVLETRVVSGCGGGPDKTILNTPRYLSGSGYRTVCAYMHPPDDPGFEQLRQKAEAWKAPLLSVPDRGPWDWRVVPELLRICRRERVAIWHGHDYKSNVLGLLLRRHWPMRLLSTVHGWVQRTARTPLYYGIDRLCLPHYERVICVSDDLHERCLRCGVPRDRCVLIENAVDTQDFTRSVALEEAKRRLEIPASRVVLGAIGRLSAEKGFDLLIRAACRLLDRGRDIALLIAGDGGERGRLESLIAGTGRGDRIRLLGYRPDTLALYQAMDVLVLSSFREGLPNVLLEAMAVGVPVVATRVAGVPRLIEDGVNGLLVDAGNVDQLAGAVDRLIRDEELRRRLAHAGCATVKAGYSFEARMRKIVRLYNTLLNRDPCLT